MSRRGPPSRRIVDAEMTPVVVSFSEHGDLLDVVGDLEAFVAPPDSVDGILRRLQDLQLGMRVRERLVPAVELTRDRYADVHIVREEGDSHYVLLDCSRKMRLLHSAQQARNELALLQRQAQRTPGRAGVSASGTNATAVQCLRVSATATVSGTSPLEGTGLPPLLFNVLLRAVATGNEREITMTLREKPDALEVEIGPKSGGFREDHFHALVTLCNPSYSGGAGDDMAMAQRVMAKLGASAQIVPLAAGGYALWIRIPFAPPS